MSDPEISRRAFSTVAAWSIPIVAVAVAAPMAAASHGITVRGVVGGDSYLDNDWNASAQVPVDAPFTLHPAQSASVNGAADFAVGSNASSRWYGQTGVDTYTVPAGYKISNIVVVVPWLANSPLTTPFLTNGFASRWDDGYGMWLNSDPGLTPVLDRAAEGHPGEYATGYVDPTTTWGQPATIATRTTFALHQPYLGTNSFTFPRADGGTSTATVANTDTIVTTAILPGEYLPGQTFSVPYRTVREVAWVNNGNTYHGWATPSFVIADYIAIH